MSNATPPDADAPEPSAPPDSAPTTPDETITAWAGYAKDRFDAASRRVDEFRNWARQLAGVIGVVVGFEFTLIGRALDIRPPFDTSLRTLALLIFVLTILFQLVLLYRVLRTGYSGHQVIGPESPAVLAAYVVGKDATTTCRIFGAYYAKATDSFHDLSEKLGHEVASASRLFSRSLFSLVVGLALLIWLVIKSYTGSAMTTPTAPQTPPTAATPSPAAAVPASPAPSPAPPAAPTPSAAPMLTTPTAGHVETFTAKPAAPTKAP